MFAFFAILFATLLVGTILLIGHRLLKREPAPIKIKRK